LVYGALVRRGVTPWRLTTLLGVAGFVGLWALFGPVLDANDAGGTLLLRRAVAAITLAVDVAVGMAVLHLVLGRALAPSTANAPRTVEEDRRRFLGGLVT